MPQPTKPKPRRPGQTEKEYLKGLDEREPGTYIGDHRVLDEKGNIPPENADDNTQFASEEEFNEETGRWRADELAEEFAS